MQNFDFSIRNTPWYYLDNRYEGYAESGLLGFMLALSKLDFLYCNLHFLPSYPVYTFVRNKFSKKEKMCQASK